MTSYAILPNEEPTRASHPVTSQKLSLIECQLTSGIFKFNSLAKLAWVFNPSTSPREASVPAAPKNDTLKIRDLISSNLFICLSILDNHVAALYPKGTGNACCRWVLPAIGVLIWSFTILDNALAIESKSLDNKFNPFLICNTSAVSIMSCVVAPQ